MPILGYVVVEGRLIEEARTFESEGIAGQSCIDPSKDFAKSCKFKVLSFSQFESYPKLWILTSWNPGSCGSHLCGQYSDGSPDFVHVLRDPPPKPWTKMRSAVTAFAGW